MKEKFFYVYQITNLLNGKVYVGIHQTYNLNDGYMGSSRHLSKDIRELGIQNFKKEILHFCSDEHSLQIKEAEIVTPEFVKRNDTYNKMIGGVLKLHSLSQLGKLRRDILTEMLQDPEVQIKYGEKIKEGWRHFKLATPERYEQYLLDMSIRKKHEIALKKLNGTLHRPRHSMISKKRIGLANATHQKGSGNSQHGTFWITNGIENKKLRVGNMIPTGFMKGRKIFPSTNVIGLNNT